MAQARIAAAALAAALWASPALAAIEVPARAVWSVTDVDSLQFCDKCDPTLVASSQRVENYRRTIADTVALGARQILMHARKGSAVRVGEFAQAAADWNAAASPADKVCIALMYADYGVFPANDEIDALWTTAWASSGANYCAIGGRAVVASLEDRPDSTCTRNRWTNVLNRITTVVATNARQTAVHWIAAFGETGEFQSWSDLCRNKATDVGLPITYSFLEMANDSHLWMADWASRRAAVEQGGGRYILGIPTASGRNCGDFCGDNDATAYTHTDFGGFARGLAAWRSGANNVAYTYGPGGVINRDEFVSSSIRCDANDMATSAAECAAPAAEKIALLPGVPRTTTIDEPPPQTEQCSSLRPPAVAQAAGLTKLAFCDDFSTDTVARGGPANTSPAPERDIVAGKKWTTERTGNGVTWGNPPTAASSFVFNADGTLTVTPDRADYNWFMSSTVARNGALKGFWLKKEPKWFAEIRWKFQKGTAGARQPGFWSMDTCHLYNLPARCPGPNREYVEPDFWEYVDQNSMGLHYYHETKAPDQGQISCGGKRPEAAAPGENVWFTAGHMFTGNQQQFTRNGATYYTRNATDTCYKPGGSVWTGSLQAGVIFDVMLNGDYPILIGSKAGEIITIDYVAVWVAP